MSIKQLSNGKFHVRFAKRHPDTRESKSVFGTASTMAEAKRIERHLPLVWEEKHNPKNSPDIKLETLLERYLAELEIRSHNGDISPATVKNYKLCLEAHALPLWRGRPIGKISTDEIRTLIRASAATISHQKNLRKFLNGLFGYAVEANYMPRNPVPIIHFRKQDKIMGVLNEKQTGIFLDAARIYHRDDWYPVWAGASYTGARNGELHALTWDKVDLENRTAHVTCSWDAKNGHKDLVKNGEDRVIEIALPMIPILKELRAKNPNSVFVFPRIPEWDQGRQAEILRTFLKSLGLPGVRFHDLRASWCTACLAHGIPLVKVMAMGGWRDLKTMQRYVRKAGLTIKGMTDTLNFHNPTPTVGDVIPMHRDVAEAK